METIKSNSRASSQNNSKPTFLVDRMHQSTTNDATLPNESAYESCSHLVCPISLYHIGAQFVYETGDSTLASRHENLGQYVAQQHSFGNYSLEIWKGQSHKDEPVLLVIPRFPAARDWNRVFDENYDCVSDSGATCGGSFDQSIDR